MQTTHFALRYSLTCLNPSESYARNTARERISKQSIDMPLQPVPAHVIRSSNQRALIAHWNELASDRRFPAITGFSPRPAAHSPEQLIMWDVEGIDSGEQRFRMRQLGARAIEALGNAMIGKTMDELVPPSLRASALDAANDCATSGCAIYMVISTISATGCRVECERLLLPFGDGDAVQQIAASLQLISFDGAVERQGIARDFEMTASVSFSGMIASDFAARHPQGAPSQQPDAPPDNPAEVAPTVGKRAPPRRKVRKSGKIFFGRGNEICTVRDMSATDATIEVGDPGNVPHQFTLVLEMESVSRRCSAIWRKDRQIGVRFG